MPADVPRRLRPSISRLDGHEQRPSRATLELVPPSPNAAFQEGKQLAGSGLLGLWLAERLHCAARNRLVGRRCLHQPPPGRRRHAQEAFGRLCNVPLRRLCAGRFVAIQGGFPRCAGSGSKPIPPLFPGKGRVALCRHRGLPLRLQAPPNGERRVLRCRVKTEPCGWLGQPGLGFAITKPQRGTNSLAGTGLPRRLLTKLVIDIQR